MPLLLVRHISVVGFPEITDSLRLVYPQKVTLYQVGDTVEGASFGNFLDAIDGSYCTFAGGDDPTVLVAITLYPHHY
jgi:hypothetical protein